MSPRLKRLFIGFAVIAVIAIILWWLSAGKQSTDDAFIERNVTYLKPQVSGPLIAVKVTDNQAVHSGDVLFQIDPAPFKVALESAQAKAASASAEVRRAQANLEAYKASLEARQQDAEAGVAVAQAQVTQQKNSLVATQARIEQAQRNLTRYEKLAVRRQVSAQTVDDAKTQLRTLSADLNTTQAAILVAQRQVGEAKANLATVDADRKQLAVLGASIEQAQGALKEANAAVDQAQLNLQWTTITAPVDGHISEVETKVGSMVGPDTTLVIEVAGKPWVTANYKETDIGGMHVGDKVKIKVDAYPGQTLEGQVQSFQPGTGARFSLLPPENATGNFVKVVQRIPVRITLDKVPDDMQLWPGMSVVPTVYLNSGKPH
ncbi:HlyD family secretion protein [Mangrovitalea sediminis]|uniref:HlyD family secretion protein n=1 Tax=Mangrovitalea sediminis TaxID=1982043 RepID=UPI000BE52A38|nr:HlyD family secretion protein [Mangrovitalea sediminis]